MLQKVAAMEVGLYDLEMVLLWEHYFQMDRPAYNSISLLGLSLWSPIEFIQSPIRFIQKPHYST